MSAGVFTPELRFEWVKGQVTSGTPDAGFVACGDGTAFPMLVTPDQLAEIVYRVRYARWVSGATSRVYDDGSYTLTWAVTFTSTTPSIAKVEVDNDGSYDVAYTRRGYVAVTHDTTPDGPLPLLGANFLSATQYLTFQGLGAASATDLAFREDVCEYSVWIPALSAGEDIGEPFYWIVSDAFKTGFSLVSQFGGTSAPPDIYAAFVSQTDSIDPSNPDYGGYCAVILEFSGQVAWVDVSGSGHPFDPANQLYLGVKLTIDDGQGVYGYGDTIFGTDVSTMNSTPTSSKVADLKLKLSGVDQYVTAEIYGSEDSFYGSSASTSTDWIFEATEWWPYAKDSPATPVWNGATGAKL